jgi:hypothetical protein
VSRRPILPTRRTFVLALLAAAGGCRRAPTRPAGTSALDAARAYHDALLHRDWPKAYGLLHPDSRGSLAESDYSRLAEGYRAAFGFEPSEVHVGPCQEQVDTAVAHVTFGGWSASKHKRFKDAVQLRRSGAAWGVVLRPNFGPPGQGG